MTFAEIRRRRLCNQQLVRTRFTQPADVVSWLGAMQAQEYAMAKWAISLRLPTSDDVTIERALNDGSILRTHVLRPTWHFVTPADIRWMLELTGPRVRAALAYNDRKLEVTRPLLRRSHAVILKALTAKPQLTRVALAEELRRARIVAEGPRLAHLIIHAELDGLICSGPREARHNTYALLEQRAAPAKPRDPDEALAELAQRYFFSRGPATAQDFAWWSGLTLGEARRSVSMLGDAVQREQLERMEYVWGEAPCAVPTTSQSTFLLPDYDEYGIGYKDRQALVETNEKASERRTFPVLAFNRMILINGQLAGSWRRTEVKKEIEIELRLHRNLDTSEKKALIRAVQRYGAFLRRPVRSHLSGEARQ